MDPTQGDESPINLLATIPDSQAEGKGKSDEDTIKYWGKEITDAHRREKDWRKSAQQAVELYEASKQKDYQFNILYSNTEILAPALYNQVPRPVVTRRFKDPDPLGKVCSEVVQRTLSFLADSNESEFPSFDEFMTQAVLESLVPGRGVTRFKHEVEFQEVPNGLQSSGGDEQEGGDAAEASAGNGTAGEATGAEEGTSSEVAYETVVPDCIPWERFTHGYAKQWRHVPWVAFDHYMTREELCQNFGKNLGAQVKLTESEKESEEGERGNDKWSNKGDMTKGVKLGLVHEIWNKVDHTVLFISPGLPKEFLRGPLEDPLGVTGFFPCPEPLKFFKKIKTLVPTALYAQYQEQHRELNRLTIRINRIIGAMKVRGFYDKRMGGIDRLVEQDDNTLLPAENQQLFGPDAVNLDNLIWLWPIDKLVGVLQQLYAARDQCKAVIYEITGVADVLRGASKASETLGAQEIKEQWGSLRISRMQKQVQNYARSCFRMMAEISFGKLNAQTIAKMTGLQYPTAAQKAQAQQMLQMAQQVQQALSGPQAGVQSPGAPGQGQPTQQPQIPPQIQQALVQAQQVASQPSWEEIMAVLADSLTRSYRIDIETNSTIDPEASDDKQQISEFFIALGQFVSSIMPLVESGAMPMTAVKGMLLVVTRRFRFGPDMEDYLDQIQQPQPKADPKMQAEQVKAQAEVQKANLDQQLAEQKHQHDMQVAQQDAAMAAQKHQQELQLGQQKMEIEAQKLELERRRLGFAQEQLAAEVVAAREIAKTKPKQVAVTHKQNGRGR